MIWRSIRLSQLPLRNVIVNGVPHVQVRPASTLGTSTPNIATILATTPTDDRHTITAIGSVRTVRNQKNRSFLELGDGSTTQPLQAVLEPSQAEGYARSIISRYLD